MKKTLLIMLAMVIGMMAIAYTVDARQTQGVAAQAVKAAGIVVDENDQPLPGCAVVIESTGKGTLTDVNGKFSLAVPDTLKTLLFKYIGYDDLNAPVGPNMRVKMKVSVQEL